MMSLNNSDTAMITHAAELVTDQMYNLPGYTRDDDKSAKVMTELGKLSHAFVISGTVLTVDQGAALMKQVILSEMNNWIPNSSQRLIHRASMALGFDLGFDISRMPESDHGPLPQNHALVQNWVCGIYTMQCATCAHLFRV